MTKKKLIAKMKELDIRIASEMVTEYTSEDNPEGIIWEAIEQLQGYVMIYAALLLELPKK